MELFDSGGDGAPVLFLHGAFVDRTLWDPVVALLPGRRCLVPTLPLGSHREPVPDRSPLTPVGVADTIADLIAELGLTDLTVVANDTGGALLQLLLARRPEGIARVVFTPCDALEVFPPALFKPLFLAGRSPYALAAFIAPLRVPRAWRLPIGFGWLTKRASDETGRRLGRARARELRDRARRRALPARVDPGAAARRRAQARGVRGRGRSSAGPRATAAFKVELGRRLAAQFRDARFVEIERLLLVRADRPAGRARPADLDGVRSHSISRAPASAASAPSSARPGRARGRCPR